MNQQTFGPRLILGKNCYPYNLLSVTPTGAEASTNPDGSVFISGTAGDGYGASICTMQKVGSTGQGFAVGGGAYIELTAKFQPTLDSTGGGHLPFPAGWALGVKHLLQVGGVNRWPELDFMQWVRNSLNFIAMACLIDWPSQTIQPANGLVLLPAGFDFAQYHRYAVRWEKATPTTQGVLRSYIDRTEVKYAQTGLPGTFYPITWPWIDPASTTVIKTGGNILDENPVALILGTSPLCPMTVDSLNVWQTAAATASNLIY